MHLISIVCGLGICVFAKFCLESIVEMDHAKKISVGSYIVIADHQQNFNLVSV